MDIVKPNVALFLLPEGTREANYAEHQPELPSFARHA